MDQNHLLQNFQSLINMVVFGLGLWLSLAKTENYLEQNFPASLTSPGPDLEVCLVCLVSSKSRDVRTMRILQISDYYHPGSTQLYAEDYTAMGSNI